MPIDNSASFLNAQIVRSCFFNTVVCSCVFAFRPNAPLVFCDMCGRIGNEMHRKKKIFGHEKVSSVGQKQNDGDANPYLSSPFCAPSPLSRHFCSRTLLSG